MNTANTDDRRAWPMRLWLAAPDWLFRAAGAVFFFGYFYTQSQKYFHPEIPFWEHFWTLGPFCVFPSGHEIRMPWVPLLIDVTFLQIALAFCFRIQSKLRADNGWAIAYTLLTAFAPLVPIWLEPLLGYVNVELQQAYQAFLWRTDYTWQLALALGVIMTIGMVIEVWGYAVLARSLSIVPEARNLKVSGPYRLVRHPIYFGQFLAQGGFFLIAAKLHWFWISVYVLFVAMQLYRSKLEDRVLEQAFGEPYRAWKAKTFWFV